MAKAILVAEIGWNHMGDMSIAKDMIQAAAEAGADYAKFQTWKVSRLKPGPWDTDGRRQIYEKAELSEDNHFYLKEECDKAGIQFLTSLFCVQDLELVKKVCNDIKVPSPEADQAGLVEQCSENFRKVFVSTGASDWDEYCEWGSLQNVWLLHCVSAYPCDVTMINLPRIDSLKMITPRVGYSGHSPHHFDAIAAVCRGVDIVEKHFTTDHNLPGRDNRFALLPDEFAKIRRFIDEYDQMLIHRGFGIQDCEQEYRKYHKGRWG